MINFTKEQKEILKYTSGNMCISAVPGAGKTFILTHLAYNLSKILKNDEQILVLTYMNSATFNFYNNLKNKIEIMKTKIVFLIIILIFLKIM